MSVLSVFLMVLGCVLLLLAGFNIPSSTAPNPPRVNFGWLGMFFWAVAVVLATAKL
jgi:hypothetical protein